MVTPNQPSSFGAAIVRQKGVPLPWLLYLVTAPFPEAAYKAGQPYPVLIFAVSSQQKRMRKLALYLLIFALYADVKGQGVSELPLAELISASQEQRLEANDMLHHFLEKSSSRACEEGFLKLANDTVRVLDAWGKPGAGILEGNMLALGSYDECKSVEGTGYCRAAFTLSKFPLPYTLGVCLPAKCTAQDIDAALKEVLALLKVNATLPVITCESFDKTYNPGGILMIFVCCVFACLVLVATVMDMLLQLVESCRGTDVDEAERNVNLEISQKNNVDEKTHLLQHNTEELMKKRPKHDVAAAVVLFLKESFLAFSLYRTLPSILSTKQSPSAINCINGIRVLSMFWVIGAHTNLWMILVSDNIIQFLTDIAPRFSYQAVSNGFYSVDSFFFLSGLLVAYLTLREMKRRHAKGKTWLAFPALSYYIHRFLRLTPGYAFVLFFVWQVAPLMGSGPLWNSSIQPQVTYCDKYWYSNLLYINNFLPEDFNQQCVGWGWYLANDMQFFLISPVMLIPLFFLWPLGIAVTIVILLVCIFITGVLAGVYNLGMSNFAALAHPVANATYGDFNDIYYGKPYCRIMPYLVGILLGYALYKEVKLPFKRVINTVLYSLMVLLALGLTMTVVYAIYPMWHGHQYSVAEQVNYLMYCRLTWGIGLALIVFACHNGYGWWIDVFLSWKVWIPLSRLTFMAYLIHPLVLFLMTFTLRTPLHFSDITLAVYMVAAVVLSYGAAALVAIAVEFPLGEVEMALFRMLGIQGRQTKNLPSNKEKMSEKA